MKNETTIPRSFTARTSFLILLSFLASTIASVALNVPVLRQLFGSLFLAFVPGLLIVYVLRLKLDLATKFVLSVGLSAAFVILFGMAVSTLGVALGYNRPLSTLPLVLTFGTATAILAAVAWARNRHTALSLPDFRLAKGEKALLIVPSLFPSLSLLGTHLIKSTGSNVLLIILFLVIAAYVVGIILWHTRIPERIYPCVIFLISISLIMVLALRSNHLIASDGHEALRIFRVTVDNAHWGMWGISPLLETALSISILPSVYQLFLDGDPEHLFMVLFPLIFSVSPLVVYIIAKKYMGGFYGFLAAFFFMSQLTFLDTHDRTSIAILFFALALMALFHNGLDGVHKRILFMLFSVSIVASHYSTTYVFFFLVLLTWMATHLLIWISKLAARPRGDSVGSGPDAQTTLISGAAPIITVGDVALVLVLLYFWYAQVTTEVFAVSVGVLHRAASFHQAFSFESKSAIITAAVGYDIITIPQKIRVILSWISIALIATGVLVTAAKYKSMVAAHSPVRAKERFPHSLFDQDFFGFALACSAVLVGAILLPFISGVYDLERISFTTLPVLATFFVTGAAMLARWLKLRPGWLIAAVLVPFFLTTTGVTYQAFKIPASMALNSEGKEYELWYVHDKDSYGAKWLDNYAKDVTNIYGPFGFGERVLIGQTKLPRSQLHTYQPGKDPEPGGFVYLRYMDTRFRNTVVKYPSISLTRSRIYSNGGSEIYR